MKGFNYVPAIRYSCRTANTRIGYANVTMRIPSHPDRLLVLPAAHSLQFGTSAVVTNDGQGLLLSSIKETHWYHIFVRDFREPWDRHGAFKQCTKSVIIKVMH